MDDEKIEGQTKYMQVVASKKQIIWRNFLGGISWSFGAFLGIILIGAIIGLVASKIHFVPVIGNWLGDIIKVATRDLKIPNTQ